MGVERQLPNGEQELLAPAGVVGRGDVKDDEDEPPDVLNSNGLDMEV